MIGIKIKNFGLLKDFRLGTAKEDILAMRELKERKNLPALQPLSVFIGQNASGKSTFFESLKFLAAVVSLNVHIAGNQARQGSYSALIHNREPDKYDLSFDLIYEKDNGVWLDYTIVISADEFFRPYIVSEKLMKYFFRDGAVQSCCWKMKKNMAGFSGMVNISRFI